MAKFRIKGNWNEIKGEFQQEYADLTDENLKSADGHEDELPENLQKKRHKTKD